MNNQLFRDVSDREYEQHLKNLRVYGYSHVRNLLLPETLDRALALVEHHYDVVKDAEYNGRPARDTRDLRIYNLQNKDIFFVEILSGGFIRRCLMELINDPYYRFLPPDVPNYILQNFNARSSGNALELHIDSRVPGLADNPWSVQMGFVLDSMTTENGCSVVVPGSHRSGTFTDRELDNLVELHAEASDLILWDSRTWHGTRENVSNARRWVLFASFCMWWMKQDVDMTRSMPEDLYAQLSDEQKQLIGYCALPPRSEFDRINIKCGYDHLKPRVADYFQ